MAPGNGSLTAAPQAGALARQDILGGGELAVSSDVQATALAAQAEANVKARWAIALKNPRNMDGVRVRLLAECQRPKFAEQAEYAKPVGNRKVTGPSIRFVEAAIRCMTNVDCPTIVVSEDERTRRLQVAVVDLESNVAWSRQITLSKTVERSSDEGRTVVSKRTNSRGKATFEVAATEDELANKEAAMVSKAIRTAGLRVLPGDLVEEAMEECRAVRAAADKADPQAAKKKLMDAFVSVGVKPEQLSEYLGHSLDAMQPAELDDLRAIFAAIRDGESKWSDVLELKAKSEGGVHAPPDPKASPPKQGAPANAQGQAPADDPLSKELAALEAGVREAGSRDELQKLAKRIGALPEPDRARLLGAYEAKAKGFKS